VDQIGTPIDPNQQSVNICASNIGSKNKISIKAKDGSSVTIICTNSQTQTIQATDPLLNQQSTNICASNIGKNNKIKIKADDGSQVTITCNIRQIQSLSVDP
jgi:ribosomal protein L32E